MPPKSRRSRSASRARRSKSRSRSRSGSRHRGHAAPKKFVWDAKKRKQVAVRASQCPGFLKCVGSKVQVWNGTARHTAGGVTRAGLKMEDGRIKYVKRSNASKAAFNRHKREYEAGGEGRGLFDRRAVGLTMELMAKKRRGGY